MFIDNYICDWCSKELGDYYVSTNCKHDCQTHKDNTIDNKQSEQDSEQQSDLRFCNFICAKHYNDIVAKINIDMDKYTEYYINGKLNKFNEKIYKFISKRGFEFMPTIYDTSYPTDENTRREMVKMYIAKVYERK